MGIAYPIGIQVDKLWENPSPGVAFGAQKVSLNLSGYDAVLVECSLQGGYSQSKCELVRCGNIVSVQVFNKDDMTHGCFRTVTVSTDGVTFGVGYGYAWDQQKYIVNNNAAMPILIYGVRF